MMKWAALLLLCTPLAATATVVTGTIRLPDGTLANGRASITLSGTCVGVGGAVVVPSGKTVDIIDGALSVDLEPSSTCVPARAYKVQYSLKAGVSPVEFWQVPASGPTTIGAIRVAGTPTVLASLGLALLTGGLTKGDIIVYTGTGFTRVPRGPAGTVPRSDDSAPTGVSWQTLSAGAIYGRYSATLASGSSWTVTGATHGLGTCVVAIYAWIANIQAEGDLPACNPSTFDIVLPFSEAVAGDIYITSDPALVATSFPAAGSLLSTIVSAPFGAGAASVTITHNLNAVVMVRCFDEDRNPLEVGLISRASANEASVTFVGSVPAGFCVAAR